MIQYDDKVLADRLAIQRNNALNAAAQAEAAVIALQSRVAELEAQLAKRANRRKDRHAEKTVAEKD